VDSVAVEIEDKEISVEVVAQEAEEVGEEK